MYMSSFLQQPWISICIAIKYYCLWVIWIFKALQWLSEHRLRAFSRNKCTVNELLDGGLEFFAFGGHVYHDKVM